MKAGQLDKMLEHTELMFKMSPKVSRDESATAVNQIIDALPIDLANNADMQSKMYTLITNDLKMNNEFLWFKVSLRLSKNLLANGGETEMKQLEGKINEMKQSCKLKGTPANVDTYESYDTSAQKSNLLGLLLEALSLEIQMYSKKNDKRKTRDVYKLSQQFDSVMDDPRTKGILKESGGRMFMS